MKNSRVLLVQLIGQMDEIVPRIVWAGNVGVAVTDNFGNGMKPKKRFVLYLGQ